MRNDFFSIFLRFLFFGASVFVLGCGVRGKPLPPLDPPPIGRGEPTYQKYSERILEEKEAAEKREKKKNP